MMGETIRKMYEITDKDPNYVKIYLSKDESHAVIVYPDRAIEVYEGEEKPITLEEAEERARLFDLFLWDGEAEWEKLENLLKGITDVHHDADGDGNMVLIIKPNEIQNPEIPPETEILIYTNPQGEIVSIHLAHLA